VRSNKNQKIIKMSEKGEHIVSYLPGGAEDWSSDEDEYFQQLENKVITANGLKNEISPYEQGLQDLKYELREGNVEEMRKILDSPALIGFNIDEDEIERGWNLLLSACYYAKPEVVNFLLSERGVNVNCLSSIDYETPMMVTCLSNENPDDILEVAKILVKHSASTSVGNGMGKTALMFASAAGLIHVVEYLVSLGDNIDVTDNIGSNALIYALEQKQTEVAVFLINNGIDTTVENKYRRSAKIIAEGKRLQDVLDILPQKEKEDFLSSEFLNYTLENMIPGIGETER
jgi:ankyrin repeat protein